MAHRAERLAAPTTFLRYLGVGGWGVRGAWCMVRLANETGRDMLRFFSCLRYNWMMKEGVLWSGWRG